MKLKNIPITILIEFWNLVDFEFNSEVVPFHEGNAGCLVWCRLKKKTLYFHAKSTVSGPKLTLSLHLGV